MRPSSTLALSVWGHLWRLVPWARVAAMTYSTNLRGYPTPWSLQPYMLWCRILLWHLTAFHGLETWLDCVVRCTSVCLPGRINGLLTTVESGCFLFPTPVDFTSEEPLSIRQAAIYAISTFSVFRGEALIKFFFLNTVQSKLSAFDVLYFSHYILLKYAEIGPVTRTYLVLSTAPSLFHIHRHAGLCLKLGEKANQL